MAIPKIPTILTEADWAKHKGKFAKLAGKTGVSELLKVIAAQYRGVRWERLDITRALKSGAAAKDTEAALKAAQREYTTSVVRFHQRVAELPKLARAAEAKYRKLALKDAADHAAKVAKAAELFGAQVRLVEAELKAFEQANARAQAEAERQAELEKAKQKALEDDEQELEDDSTSDLPAAVKDIIGPRWFSDLDKVTFHKSDQLKQWTTSSELALSARDGKPAANLQSTQNTAKRELEKFQQAHAKLRALRDKTLERAAALKQAQQLWQQARGAFDQPGVLEAHHEWEVRQNLHAGTPARLAEWEKAHAAAAELHQKVAKLLEADSRRIQALETELNKVK